MGILPKKKLSTILNTFTKVEDDLVVFLDDNGKDIAKKETELANQRKEQERAKNVLRRIMHITGGNA
ncbi:MAG: hypothetical protein ACRC91_02400 [Aeromonas sp.]